MTSDSFIALFTANYTHSLVYDLKFTWYWLLQSSTMCFCELIETQILCAQMR